MQRRFLVFQHIDVEHPGIFRDFMQTERISWETIRFDLGQRIPKNTNDYVGLLSMGGPMDVWEKDQYPWIEEEEEFIRKWVLEHKKPFLGVCLGHQLLATALGGTVTKADVPEVGIYEVTLSTEGRNHNFFKECPPEFKCLQWHSAEVSIKPSTAKILAQSENCKIQALAVGNHAFSFQFHLEVIPTTVDDWIKVPAYKISLESALGRNGLNRFRTETESNLPNFNALAKKMYYNWRIAT